MYNHVRRFAISALLVATFSVPAYAQLADQTRTANPGRAEEQLNPKIFEPSLMPKVDVSENTIVSAPPGSENIKLTLRNLDVQGVSVYHNGELESLYADKIGQTITLADVYGIAAAMTRQYRNDGYILTQVVVPPQTIESGTVKLQVVEGYIDQVDVRSEGDHVNDAVLLARGYATLVRADSSALNVRQLERALLMINDIPGIRARSVLSPSKTTPGAADLLVIVERNTFDGQVTLDNYGSRYLGPVQLGASAALNGMLGWNERISAQVAYAPNEDFQDELSFIGLGYDMPLGTHGTMLNTSASFTNTEPGYNLKRFDVDGVSHFFSVGVSHPFIRSRNFNVTARALLDWRNVDTDNNIEPDRKDHIRAARIGARIEFMDNMMGVAYNMLDLELAHGLDILGSSNGRDTNVSRPGADWDFFKMESEFQRLQRVTSKVNILFGLKGQMSDEALWSSEEFGVGGVSYGRAYDPSEIVGDSGIAGKLELQWNQPVQVSVLDNYQLFSFYDAGVVWDKDATSSKLKREELTSTGFGVRADFTSATQAGAFIAWPLNRDIETQRDDDPRVYMNVSHKF